MTKQVAISIGLVAVFAIGVTLVSSTVFNSRAIAQQTTQQDSQQDLRAANAMQYGRLVFAADQKYNWIAGNAQVQRPLTVRALIARLGGDTKRASFATLLDTLGNDGWELVFETEDPEGYGDVLIFKRSAR